MAIRIVAISPKRVPPPTDPVLAHLSIEKFKWVNEQNQQTGKSTRSQMFDWLVNKNGRAYVRKGDRAESIVFVFGANSPSGQYIRTVDNEKWTGDLLDLPEFSE